MDTDDLGSELGNVSAAIGLFLAGRVWGEHIPAVAAIMLAVVSMTLAAVWLLTR